MKKEKFLIEASLISSQEIDFEPKVATLLEVFAAYFQAKSAKLYLIGPNDQGAGLLITWPTNLRVAQGAKAIDPVTLETIKGQLKADHGLARVDQNNQGLDAVGFSRGTWLLAIKVKDELLGFLALELKNAKVQPKQKKLLAIGATFFASLLCQERLTDPNIANIASVVVNVVKRYVVLFDLSGRIIFENNHLRGQLSYQEEDLHNLHIDSIATNISNTSCDTHFSSLLGIPESNLALSLVKNNGDLVNVTGQLSRCQMQNKTLYLAIFNDVNSLAQELDRFTRLYAHMPVLGAVTLLPDHRIVSVNKAFLNITGYVNEELITKTWQEMDLISNYQEVAHLIHGVKQNGKIENLEVLLKAKDGTLNDVLLSAEIISCHGQNLILAVMIDITEQKRIQNLFLEQTQRLNSIIEGTRLGTWEWNIQTGATKFNERWATMLGYTLEELEPISIETWLKLINPDDFMKAQALLEQHFNREIGFYDVEVRAKAKDGRWIWVHDRGKVIEWDRQNRPLMMYGTHSDITKKKEFEFKINDLSIRDPLTDIYNRRYIYERLDQDIQRFLRHNGIFALAILDIDRFKDVNDHYGHLAGDFIIKEFTNLIQDNLREYDLLGRYGGEEFVIIMYDTTESEAALIIERILEKVQSRSFLYHDNEIRFTFSAGVSDSGEFESDAITDEKLIGLADKRLYKAKQLGRNRIVC